ncbi:MAG: hypothetical protein KKA64_02950 [Nanoarchaeota archaeon]|nr:hypothetical protein [Nanoarchaeota archaeon]
MEARKTHEGYSINGRDTEGLIPEGTTNVIVDYKEDGSVRGIFYNKDLNKRMGETTVEDLKRLQGEVEAMNLRHQTQAEMQKVAGLLKKLVSD